ncbi:MAG: hypothetical protein V2I38_08920 [Alcanivoracaceae bacterium]|jgi:hypothetical protein|nr:hypothetical protein [Alcanivoracaceae bacterium]
MPTPVREQILAAITTAVSGEYGIPAPEDERDLPVTIVQDGQEEAETTTYNQTNVLMPVAIASAAAATSSDKDTMREQANALLSSIITTMFTDETFGDLADGIEYTGGGIQTEVGKFVFAEAQFTVRYHYLRGDPFTID